MSDAHTMPACPRCQAPMRLARVWPGSFGDPDLRSFACTRCREAITVEGDAGSAPPDFRF